MFRLGYRLFSGAARLLALIAILWMPLLPTARAAPLSALSPEDEAMLTAHLQILAVEANNDSGTICNRILAKPAYTESDWVQFFTGYFDENPFTYKLSEYLTWPSFWATQDQTQRKLQGALTTVMQNIITEVTADHPNDLSAALQADSGLRETFVNAHRWMMWQSLQGKLSSTRMQQIFTFYIDYVNDYPHYWRKSTTIDTAAKPFIAAIAAQIHANLRELVSIQIGNLLTTANTLNLQGTYRDLWLHFNLLIYDNNQFPPVQREYIYDYYNNLPRGMRHTKGISQMEYIGNGGGPNHLPILLPGVNVFGIPLDAYKENPFPPEIAPYYCDVFLEVLAHETNHSVHAVYIEPNPARYQEFRRLIDQAGSSHMNYLRSMFEDNFFYANPQEFFASVANQYLCQSELTYNVGLVRFDWGIPYPLDQALFFADIYSVGGTNTTIYRSPYLGGFWLQSAPIYRDGWGRITGITLPQRSIYVRRGADGIIQEVSQSPGAVVAPGTQQATAIEGNISETRVQVGNNGDAGLRYTLETEGGSNQSVLEFDMNSAVVVPDSPSLNSREQITIEAWVNPYTWEDGWLNNGRILQKGFADDQYRLTIEGSNLLFDLAGVGSLRIEDWKPPLNTWTHLAAVYNGERMRIYVNGELVTHTYARGLINTSDYYLFIGNKNGELKDSFIGQMDEVRVWSVARTTTEIREAMYDSLSGNESGLAGYWRFEGSGTSVADKTENHNHGVIVGEGRKIFAAGPIQWLEVIQPEDVVAPGETSTAILRWDADKIPPDSYTAKLVLRSNDPLHPIINIPLELTVTDNQPIYLPYSTRR